MTCPSVRWSPVCNHCERSSLRLDSNTLRRHRDRVKQPAMAPTSKQSSTCWSTRPRAECCFKTGRTCRHSSCQSEVATDFEAEEKMYIAVPVTKDAPVEDESVFRSGEGVRPGMHPDLAELAEDANMLTNDAPVDVRDVLHRDQRTVSVTPTFSTRCQGTYECSDKFSDIVQSVNEYEFKFSASANGAKQCCFRVKFSMQRFYSAVVCGVLLLSVLRPFASMAAPIPEDEKPNWRNPCGGSVSKDVQASLEIPQTNFTAALEGLKLQMGPIIQWNHRFRDTYCQARFYGKNCGDSFNVTLNFKFPDIPKKQGEKFDKTHFEGRDVDQLLQDAYHYLQIYALALTKLTEDATLRRDSLPIYSDYTTFRRNILLLMCELQVLLKQHNLEPPPAIDASEMDKLSIPRKENDDSTTTTLHDWAILKEALDGVEYLEQLVHHVGNQQSHL